MADGAIEFSVELDAKEAQRELNRLAKDIRKMEADLKTKGMEKLALEEQLQRAGAAADEAKAKLASLVEERDRLKSLTPADGAEYIGASSRAADLTAQIKEQEQITKLADRDFNRIETAYEKSSMAVEKINNRLVYTKELYGATAKEAAALPKVVVPLSERLEAVKQSLTDIVKMVASGLATAGRSVKKVFSSAGRWIVSSVKNLRVFSKTAEALRGKLSRMAETLKTIFFYNVVSSGLRYVREQLSSYLTTNTAVLASLNRLRGALLTAFEPIFSAVVPALTTFLDLLTRVVSIVAQFTAALFGKTAKEAQSNAKALYQQANATEEAGEAAEEAGKQLLSFDEIEKLSGTKNTSDAKNTEADANTPDFDFELDGNELYDKFADLIEKLKSLWADGAYFEFGKTIAEQLSEVVRTIDDWINGTFRPEGKKWAAIVAQVLNGLVDGWDAASTGKMLADYFNAILDIINTFLTNFDAVNMGKRVGEAINGFFTNVDWQLLGQTFGNGWNKVVDYINAVLTTTDWAAIGSGIAAAVNSWFETIDWNATGQLFANGLNALINFVYGIVNTLDWAKIGTSISQMVQGFFEKVEWSKAAQTITTGINGIVSLVQNLINGIDWKKNALSITTLINKTILGIDFKAAGKAFGSFMLNALESLKTAVANFNWGALGEAIGDFIVSIDWGKIIIDLIEIGALLILGLFKGMLSAAGRIDIWIKENIIDPVIDAFKRLFGIASPSTVMAEIGGYIVEGLIQGLLSGIAALQAAWLNIWNAMKAPINQIIAGVESFINNILDKINVLLSAISSVASAVGSVLGFGKVNLTIPRVSIPRLASGAVIPPNREFLAVLGDQGSGNNIEAPEALLRQMASEAASVNTALLRELIQAVKAGQVMEIDGMRFGRVVRESYNRESGYAGSSFVTVK